ncbi:PKD domain-containing protein [Hahella sp. HN01]|uniref:PKD domain-containing protein n=1 Tax=Hahella sp. HN01 TaxID=2847262 RepID=UPI001C1E9675|nr:PKD domain-containing protein [Hahella sp. HN01]MBU6951075.1 PKD domain-containing protein [Hahella sp. HN01]
MSAHRSLAGFCKKLAVAGFALSFLISGAASAETSVNETVLISGDGFELKQITTTDDQGLSRNVELYYIHSSEGVENAYLYGGLPQAEKEELEQEIREDNGNWLTANRTGEDRPFADTFDAWIIDRRGANLTSQAEAQLYMDEFGLQPDTDESPLGARSARLFGCGGWKDKSKSFDKSIDKTFSHNKRFGQDNAYIDFAGNMNVDADVRLELHYKYKRKFCIPYKFKVRHVVAKSNYDVSGEFSLTGVAKHDFGNLNWEIAEPKLMETVFFVGPVPVLVKLKLPIEVGTGNIQVQATGKIAAVKPLRYKGDFDYTCTTHSCTKNSAHHQNLSGDLRNSLGAEISAKINLEPYLQVAAKGIVYGEWFLYAQVGAKPSFPIELFGYYGNLCGDGDNNGVRETVNAALGAVDFRFGLTAEAKVFGAYILRPQYWQIWRTGLVFFDFLKPYSTALSPELRPAYDTAVPTKVNMPVSIRSCVGDIISRHPRDYTVDWGDGTRTALNNLGSQQTVSHNYTVNGYYLVRVTQKGGAYTEVPVIIDDDEW